MENKELKAATIPLTKVSTDELIRMIVEESDKAALKALLETRKLFRLRDGLPLLLPEYLSILRNKLARPVEYDKDIGELADCAYDLTLAKYSNIPQNNENADRCSAKFRSVDCRNYYRAFLSKIRHQIEQGKIHSKIQEELEAGKILQNLVYKNFLRSKLECRRYGYLSVRYTWVVGGHNIYLWYPSHLTADEFRNWLEKHANAFDPQNPNENVRMQELVAKELGRAEFLSLDDPDRSVNLKVNSQPEGWWEGHQFVENLGKAVAARKAQNIEQLRPGIKIIGTYSVEQMVLQIFTDLSNDQYELSEIAAKYGISKATMSRFAGSKWFERIEGEKSVEIPDLWRNTANILAENAAFMEMVLNTGYAGELKKVLDRIEPVKDEKNGR